MANKRSKRHHFVPQSLQSYFCDDGGQIWFSERTKDGKFITPEQRNTESVFKQRDYYTVLKDGAPSDVVERKFYGKYDEILGQLLRHIHTTFNNGMVPTFEDETLELIRLIVFQLAKRTPEFIKTYDEIEIGKEVTERTILALLAIEAPENQIAKYRVRATQAAELRKIGRSVRVTGQISSSPKVENALKGFALKWARVVGGPSFILSSLAAYRIGNGGSNGILNPKFELWLPVSPKLAIVLLRDETNSIPLLSNLSRAHVRSINEYAVRESNQIASHSESLLKSLIFSDHRKIAQ